MTSLQAAHWVAELGAAAAWTRTYHCQPRADVPYWAVVYLRAGEHWRRAMLHPEVVDGERGERLEAARRKPFYDDRWPDRNRAINALEQDWWENRCCCGSPSMCAPNGPIHWVELASVDSDTF